MAKENNKDRILKLLKECKNHQTAESIAVQLNIQRNTASGILNELVREGIVQKEKTRPVIFSYIQPEDQLPEDPFTTFIGADQSLKDAVEKCKLSAGYPNKGMPILLFGSSGVGKSLLAEYIYQYAKFIGTIPEDAPFVVLNCADYANNKELLSSVLFGYKKGAFTGANKDTKGLIEEADKGYLFLDEVHRLSPEGQEKLFRYMDKGIISRMGDSGQNCELNVRLIFATTEGRETMLDTFLRRIPVDVVLPDFQERTLEEKYELILFLIHQESKTMNTAFQVSSNVINRLLTFQGKGNIGTLKNIIRLSCAKAYNERSKGQEVIPLNLSHLSSDTLLLGNGESIPYINEMIEVSPDQDAVWKISMTEQADVDFSEKVINDLIQEYLEKDISTIKFRKIIYDEVNRIEDIVIDQEIHPYVQNLYTQAVRNILIYLQDNYGLKYSGVMEMVFVKMLYVLNNQNKHTDDRKYEHLAKQLQRVMYRYYKMGLIFYEMLHQAVDYETNPWFVRMFAMLYFYSIARDEMDYTNAIIVSHGPATASSITSTVNKVFETYIFEAFDMEYDTPKKDVVKRIKRYLKNTNTSKGLLIFVDMGSLLDISEDIKDDVEGDLGIVNNITVQLIEVLSVFKNMFLGFLIAVYLLASRKLFGAQAKLLLYGIFPNKWAKIIEEEVHYTDKMFNGFFVGKIIDSAIIGLICFAGTTLLGFESAAFISVVIGVTNIIPFFGPFIGAIPCALLLLLGSNPWDALYFLIFIVILQQVDGNIIGPKILGNTTGVSSFWVLFSILLFGGLWGLVGMVIAVPLFGVIYDIIRKLTARGLKRNRHEEMMQEYNEKFHEEPEETETTQKDTFSKKINAKINEYIDKNVNNK